MSAFLHDLQSLVPHVSQDPLDLLATARDMWPRDTLALTQGRLPTLPAAICWPESHAQILALLGWATERGVPVVPYGAGSGVCGGASGRDGAVVLDLKHMAGLDPVDPRGVSSVACGPGLLGQHLEDRLALAGWTCGHSPSSIWCSTVGGWAAARSAGQFSSLYGKFEDMVLAMEVATPSGTVTTGLQTPRGEEDLGPLFLGSEGTLGVITRIRMRVVPCPEQRQLGGWVFPDLESATEAMRGIMQADLRPAVLRLYDPVDSLVGGRTGKKRAHKENDGAGALKRLFQRLDSLDAIRHRELNLAFCKPRLLNGIAGALGRKVLLIAGWEGDADTVRTQVEAARPFFAEARDLGPETGEHWYTHRHDVSYKLSPVFCRGAFADTMEVASSWTCLLPMYHAVREALGHHAVVMAHMSHAYPEGCSIYFSFAGRGDLSVYDAAWREALRAVREAGGTVTHHHGVGALKAEAATREQGHALRVYDVRKRRLDPGGIMNPGRLFRAERPVDRGPPPPTGEGPVFSLDRRSLLAIVDPRAEPDKLMAALAKEGLSPRIPSDRPLDAWLRGWRPETFPHHESPCFGLQARFADGCSAWLGVAPRSAAGPDLRWGLLRDARAEKVEIPLIPISGAGAPAPRAPSHG